MSDVALANLLEPHKSELRQLAQHLAGGDHAKFVAGAATLIATLATGNPAVPVLLPFTEKAVARAFASAADKRLSEELAKLEDDEARQAFVRSIADAVEVLLGQAVLQIVRVEHQVKEEIFEALGGLRDDFSAFREDFKHQLDTEIVRIDVQRVLAGGVGIYVSPGASERVFVRKQVVSGAGSKGVVLGRR
jgi:hypothetical protein